MAISLLTFSVTSLLMNFMTYINFSFGL